MNRIFWGGFEYQNGPVAYCLFLGFWNVNWWAYDPWRTLRLNWNRD